MSSKQFTGLLLVAALLGCQPRESFAQHGTAYVEHHHSSTFEESVLYGRAQFLRCLGAGLRDMAEGQKALAEAQQKHLENRRSALSYHFEGQRLNTEQRSAERGKPSTAEDLARRAKVMAPRPLSQVELAADGTVQWPVVLCDLRHDGSRKSIEIDLKLLATETDPRRFGELRRSLVTGCESLDGNLRERITELSAHDYMEAHKFLDSLRFDAQKRRAPTANSIAMH